ncbi:MAG: hypothetical protein JW889_06385, partial [Verrucomicrobia bacterium]|nr:hypothetical protein [Verrucomicrobiota bacterium]
AEPVWEEEGSGDDITYTPRPPETAEEYVPSQILTGAHRVKTDYSPLYVGDMTSSSGGLAYVRAVITGVSISSGKVVAGRGSETIVAAWVQVQSIEEVSAVDGAGDPVGEMALCMPEKVGGYTIYAYQDYAEAFALAFYEELDPSEADSITAGFMEQWETLEETGPGTLVFTDEESTIAVAFQNTPSLNEDECDVVEVVVTATAYGLSQRELELYEEDADSCSFVPKYLTVVLSAPGGLSESEKDSVHCVITCSHDPCEEITSTFTESAVASRVFLPPGAALDTFSVSGTGALDPLTAEELTLCFSMKTLNDYCGSVVVRETSADSRVFMSHLPVSVVLQEVPAVVDQGVCHATVRKWPGVVGQSTRIYLASSEECICLSAIASTSGTYQVEEDIVLLPTTTEINPDFYDDCPNGYRGVRVLKNMRDTLGGISLSREELEDRDGYIAALLTTYKKFMAIYEKQPDLIDLSDADSAVLTKFEKLLRPIALHGCAVVADPWISTRSNIHQDKIRKKLWGLGYCVIKESDITKARLKKLMQMENRFSKSIPNDQNLHLIDIWYFDAHGSSEGFKLDTRVKPEDLPQLESFRRLTFVNACWSGVSSVSDDGGSSTYGALHDATYAEAPGSTQDATVAAFQRKFNSVEYLGHPAVIGIRLKRGMAELLFTYAYKLPKGGRARPLVSQAVDAVNDEAATWGSNVNKKALARHVMEEYQGLADDWYRINRRLPTTQSKWDWWDE